ncbi:flagellar motor protein MotB [Beijerinckia sp. L45]|uniref:flagellar motor protein MotB n=1 Tax=Beijerinckia sp. L45 TaxID=1641855 RepID=UPI00131E74A1|nr:flagellar motor protein MotB [Beijerinckia sp. L45]
MADGEHAHEVFIIKRHGGGHEDAHHGGVWKIAFADFMTAMMAFFLVMWLISANDKTKATIASYFNPVKLVDTTTQPKGLEDAKAVESAAPSNKGAKNAPAKETPSKEHPKAEAQDAAQGGGEEAAAKAKEKRLSAAVLDDPYAALTEIAGAKGAGERAAPPPSPSNTKSTVNAITRKGGEAFRDPFAPPPPLQASAPPSDLAEMDAQPLPPGGNPAILGATSAKGEAAVKSDGAATEQGAKSVAAEPATSSNDIKAQIIAASKGTGQDKSGPQIDVRKTDGGLLISLTDTSDYEMFSSASAVPTRKVVVMMERIAQILKTKPGKIVIRGFTDSRPYKAGRYDNWHLSLDRAQVTHYMLVRGGLDEARIGHIEGYADHNPKAGVETTSPVNRRIEILLKGDTP